MWEHSVRHRNLLWKGLLGLALLPLFPGSCQRRPQAPAAPPPPNYLEQGDRYFDAGHYPSAVSAYSAYLTQNPAGAQRDRVLFRLGLAYSLPANPARDPVQAMAYLNELASRHPSSPLRPQAELLATLEGQIQQLHSDIAERQQQVANLSQEMEQLRRQESELQRLQSDLKSREERIRQLTEELEKLKAIDMQRRPATPPR
ncbi:MAG: hypothetical protein A3H94_06470 [Acidobacteria bacterium RIFCSPLOWO2_02_FULL_60_20]|nr:MAG: hypothetical protein A3H94_06470 [Acidobacteria bacterium RIFCSPLOWO2_02_FULL_60_20]